MADKKITDLQLISSVTDGVNIPGDDTIQTYRLTAAQLATYMALKLFTPRTISAGATALTSADRVVLLNPTSGAFTQPLPALAGIPDNFTVYLKNIATNGNVVTVDGNSSELIDNALTLDLGSDPVMEGVLLLKTSTKWLIL